MITPIKKRRLPGLGLAEVDGQRKLLAGFLLAIAFTVPLAVYKGTFNQVLVKISLAQVFLLLLLAVWLHRVIMGRRETTLVRSSLDGTLCLFFFLSLISLLFSPYRWAGGAEISRLATYLLLYGVSVNLLRDRRNLHRLVFLWLLSTGLVSLYGLYQYFFKGMVPPRSTFGNANFFAAYLVLPFPLALTLFINSIVGLRKNWGRISSLAILLAAMILCLFLASSRGAWLGAAVSLISLAWLGCLRLNRRRLAAWVIPIFLIVILGLTAFLSPRLLEKESVKEELEKGTLGLRILIWEGTLRMIAAHPFLGSGPGSFIAAYPQYRIPEYFGNPHAVDATAHAHNEFLEMAAETGILGLAAFLGVLVVFFGKGIDIVRRENAGSGRVLVMGLISGVAGLLAANLGGVNLRFPSSAIFLWLALGLVMSQSSVTSYRLRVTKLSLPRRRVIWGLFLFLMAGVSWPVVAKPFLADWHFQKGINYRKGEDWEKAISEYRKAVELDPYFIKVYYRLGFAYAAVGDLDGALSAYKRVTALAPDFAHVQANMAFLYKEKGELDKAIRAYQRALELNPHDAAARYGLEEIYDEIGADF